MNRTRLITLVVLVLIFVLCIGFSWTTRDAMSSLPFLGGQNRYASRFGGEKTIVDLSPWQTAQAMSALAVSSEERQYAREAERLAAHEADQAFALALRQASTQRPVLSAEAQAISKKIEQLQQTAKADQARVDGLTGLANRELFGLNPSA